jgi:hypothetical protein
MNRADAAHGASTPGKIRRSHLRQVRKTAVCCLAQPRFLNQAHLQLRGNAGAFLQAQGSGSFCLQVPSHEICLEHCLLLFSLTAPFLPIHRAAHCRDRARTHSFFPSAPPLVATLQWWCAGPPFSVRLWYVPFLLGEDRGVSSEAGSWSTPSWSLPFPSFVSLGSGRSVHLPGCPATFLQIFQKIQNSLARTL